VRSRFASVALLGTSTRKDPAVSPSSPIVLASSAITRSGDRLTIDYTNPSGHPPAVLLALATTADNLPADPASACGCSVGACAAAG
jgi:hypothetical protein